MRIYHMKSTTKLKMAINYEKRGEFLSSSMEVINPEPIKPLNISISFLYIKKCHYVNHDIV